MTCALRLPQDCFTRGGREGEPRFRTAHSSPLAHAGDMLDGDGEEGTAMPRGMQQQTGPGESGGGCQPACFWKQQVCGAALIRWRYHRKEGRRELGLGAPRARLKHSVCLILSQGF